MWITLSVFHYSINYQIHTTRNDWNSGTQPINVDIDWFLSSSWGFLLSLTRPSLFKCPTSFVCKILYTMVHWYCYWKNSFKVFSVSNNIMNHVSPLVTFYYYLCENYVEYISPPEFDICRIFLGSYIPFMISIGSKWNFKKKCYQIFWQIKTTKTALPKYD